MAEAPVLTAPLAPAAAPPPVLALRTRALLEGPVVPTLLRLAGPNVVVMIVQAAVNAGEAYYIGWLGPDALAYSNVVFGGALAVWLFNTLSNVVRGTGNMALPAGLVVVGAVLVLAAAPALIFGWGPVPALGIAGAGAAFVAYYAGATVV